MKINTEKAVTAFRILNKAKIGKMKDGDKFSIVKIMKELKPLAMSYDDFIKDASEKLRPESMDSINEKILPFANLPLELHRAKIKEVLTPEELAEWDKYNADVAACIQEELEKEVEFSFKPLSEEGFKGLLDSNDLTLAEIMALNDVIGG